jgi:hypothetical protein
MLLSGKPMPGYNITVLPELLDVDNYLSAKKFATNDAPDRKDANLRQLKAMWWVGRWPSSQMQPWVFFLDDDTFVNLPLLLRLIRQIPSSLPLLVGHIWHGPGTSWPSGGAGMLMTRAALQQLASVLFSTSCDSDSYLNDVTVGKCAVAANVTKVHSNLFLPEAKALHDAINQPWTEAKLDAGMLVTTHRLTQPVQMASATCIVADRFEWSHPKCKDTIVCGSVCSP